jgi:hypothetical protein
MHISAAHKIATHTVGIGIIATKPATTVETDEQ